MLLPGREDRDIWAYFASLAFPPERRSARSWPRWPRRAAAVDAGAGDGRGPVPRPAGVHAQGARRRRRGAPGRRRLGRHRPAVALRRGALRGWPRSVPPRRRPCWTTGQDGCRMGYLRSARRPGGAPCGRCDNCTGHPAGTRWPGERVRGAQAAVAPAWDRAAADVADRAGRARRGRGRDDPRACRGGRPGAGRLSDMGWGDGSAPCWRRTRRTSRSPAGGRGRGRGAGRLGLGPAPGRRAHPAVTHQAPADHQPRPPARQRGAAALPRRARLHRRGRPRAARGHNSAQRLSSLWHALEIPDDVRDSRRRPWTARCSWWTTASRPGGR